MLQGIIQKWIRLCARMADSPCEYKFPANDEPQYLFVDREDEMRIRAVVNITTIRMLRRYIDGTDNLIAIQLDISRHCAFQTSYPTS